jgi:hypothetical protein
MLKEGSGWGRRRGGELAGGVVPIINELVGLEEQCGADGQLIEPAGVEEAGNGQLGEPGISRGQVNLRLSAIGQGDVDLHKVVETGEGAAAETGPGLFGAGDGDPDVALLRGEGAPTGGDGTEILTDNALSGGVGVKGDERRDNRFGRSERAARPCFRISPIFCRALSY